MSKTSGRVRAVALSLACAAGFPVAARAQNIIDWNSATGWTAPAAPVVNVTQSGVPGGSYNWAWNTAAPDPLVFRGDGWAREDRDGANTPDNAGMEFKPFTNTFKLALPGDILAPMLLTGRFSLAGANNLSQASVYTKIELFREDTAGMSDWTSVGAFSFNQSVDGQIQAAGNHDITLSTLARFANQAAGDRRYQLRATMDLRGNANGGVPGTPGVGALNSRVDFDFRATASSYGGTFSLSGEPTGYNVNSRAFVRAFEAEQLAGTGAGAQIGIIETGRAYRLHDHYSARYTVLNGVAGENDAGEHATATTSIIGADAGANDPRSGLARGATLVGAGARDNGNSFLTAANNLRTHWGAGTPAIINFSARGGETNVDLDTFLAANPNITWVSAAGNEQINAPGVIPPPNFAFNNIAVGALDSSLIRPADFSNNSGGNYPSKPDLMAPGEYILSASVRDLNNDTQYRDYSRSFVGANYGRAQGPISGPISGTSFAAPHVSGALGMLHGYAIAHPAQYDPWSRDHRVMKAVVLAGASVNGLFNRAIAAPPTPARKWEQPGVTGTGVQGANNPLTVPRSLDPDLGAGALNAYNAAQIFVAGEVKRAPLNGNLRSTITGPAGADILGGANPRPGFWDFERVLATQVGPPPPGGDLNGKVDYILGSSIQTHFVPETGQWIGTVSPNFSVMRAALTWDRQVNAGAYLNLSHLEMRLYVDGLNPGNLAGYDPTQPTADSLVAQTLSPPGADENVKLFNFEVQHTSAWTYSINFGANLPPIWDPKFYLEIVNLSAGADVDYGLAVTVTIPSPGALALLIGAGILAGRRRRSA